MKIRPPAAISAFLVPNPSGSTGTCVHSASNRNEYQKQKNMHRHLRADCLYSGALNISQPYRPLTGIALPLVCVNRLWSVVFVRKVPQAVPSPVDSQWLTLSRVWSVSRLRVRCSVADSHTLQFGGAQTRQTPWPYSASELYRPPFVGEVSAADSDGLYFFFQVADLIAPGIEAGPLDHRGGLSTARIICALSSASSTSCRLASAGLRSVARPCSPRAQWPVSACIVCPRASVVLTWAWSVRSRVPCCPSLPHSLCSSVRVVTYPNGIHLYSERHSIILDITRPFCPTAICSDF
jgi:hypothetical protein